MSGACLGCLFQRGLDHSSLESQLRGTDSFICTYAHVCTRYEQVQYTPRPRARLFFYKWLGADFGSHREPSSLNVLQSHAKLRVSLQTFQVGGQQATHGAHGALPSTWTTRVEHLPRHWALS